MEGLEIFVVPSVVPCVAREKHQMSDVSFSVRHVVRRIGAHDPGLDPTLNPEIRSRQSFVLVVVLQTLTVALSMCATVRWDWGRLLALNLNRDGEWAVQFSWIGLQMHCLKVKWNPP